MPVSATFHTLSISLITVEDRVRKGDPNVEPLMESIQRLGLLHPIILTRSHALVAGFRRLTAYSRLAVTYPERFSSIPFQYLDELSPNEALAVELEENIKRVDLSWQDEAQAIYTLHEHLSTLDPKHTHEQTAARLSAGRDTIYRNYTVAKAILTTNPELSQASGLSAAYHAIERLRERKASQQEDLMQEIEADIEHEVATENAVKAGLPPPVRLIETPSAESVEQADFSIWASSYSGRRFNFIHCDFPYGVNMDSANLQTSSKLYNRYDDSEALYFRLLDSLTNNIERLATPSAHIMFWYSMKFHEATVELLHNQLPPDAVVQQFPLIWMKSDGKGLLPDPQRQPRRIYETALLISLGDRKIVKPVSNAYYCPTAKTLGVAEHLSEKPQPMLSYFFQLFVDETTELLDPTCGSGTALLAAEAAGAKRVFGMDILQENVEISRRRLGTARKLKIASEVVV